MKYFGKKLNALSEIKITRVISTDRFFTFLVLVAKRERYSVTMISLANCSIPLPMELTKNLAV
jgi:hypothetical protein